MRQYLPVVALLVLAVLFGALSFLASRLLAPRRPSAAKQAPYECGIVPTRENPERFPVSFYVVAMLFIMFDIELIFIYPFAVDRVNLGAYALWEMVGFSVVFFAAFVYVVARGALGFGGVASMILIGRYLLPAVIREVTRIGSSELLLVFAGVVALGAAIGTAALGFSPEMGAFLAGFLLASTPFRHQLSGQFAPVRDILMAVFFTAVGLKVDPQLIVEHAAAVVLACIALGISPSTNCIRRSTAHGRSGSGTGWHGALGDWFAPACSTEPKLWG